MPRQRFPLASLAAALALAAPLLAHADDASDCAAADGSLLSGVVLSAPSFAGGRPLKGIPLTHTHLRIRGDADGQTYDLAVDDVFAAGYDPKVEAVPAPLDTIAVGDHVQACGIPYSGGMHWVHTNCGDTPTARDPDGWLKIVDATGNAGPNLEGSETYCYLWGNGSHRRARRAPPSN